MPETRVVGLSPEQSTPSPQLPEEAFHAASTLHTTVPAGTGLFATLGHTNKPFINDKIVFSVMRRNNKILQIFYLENYFYIYYNTLIKNSVAEVSSQLQMLPAVASSKCKIQVISVSLGLSVTLPISLQMKFALILQKNLSGFLAPFGVMPPLPVGSYGCFSWRQVSVVTKIPKTQYQDLLIQLRWLVSVCFMLLL